MFALRSVFCIILVKRQFKAGSSSLETKCPPWKMNSAPEFYLEGDEKILLLRFFGVFEQFETETVTEFSPNVSAAHSLLY